MGATHEVVADERNEFSIVGIRDGTTLRFQLVPRQQAAVSVFDSAFMVGDGIWEGIRVKRGVVQFARDHLNRLFESAKAMYMDLQISKSELLNLIHQSIDANNMQDSNDVHIRLMVSRGVKATPHQNPKACLGDPLIIIIPEIKKPEPTVGDRGLRLMTVHVRRGTPDVKDEMWNHHSKATDIQACIQANVMGADEALMLDKDGFVKTCNSTNFFIVREGVDDDGNERLELWAPTRKYQMQGITRKHTLTVARRAGIPVFETDFTLTETYGAVEAFCTGTFPSQLPVVNVDGRVIGDGSSPGPLTKRIQALYAAFVKEDVGRGRQAVVDEVRESEMAFKDRKGGQVWLDHFGA